MEFKDFFANTNDHNRSLEKIIRRILSNIPLSEIYKSNRKGFIRVNNKKVDLNTKINISDKISIAEFLIEKQNTNNTQNSQLTNTKNTNINFEDIFINQNIRIINKPSGITVHKANKQEADLSSIIQYQYIKSNNDQSLSFRVGALHRLDKYTTGILCFSQSLKGSVNFTNALQQNKIQKIYLTILQGKLQKELFLKDYIKKDKKINNFYTVSVNNEQQIDSSLAITNVYPLATGQIDGIDITFAKVIIKTGKTHQIRSQCAKAGYPLLGDNAYGAMKMQNSNFYLHAWQLISESSLDINFPKIITAALPKEFLNILKKSLRKIDLKSYNINSYETF